MSANRPLVITQAIDEDDEILAFFLGWLTAWAQQVEELQVIAQRVGRFDLPDNVHIHGLGKEKGLGKGRQLFRLQQLLRRHLSGAEGMDVVFAHMCPEYLLAAAPVAKAARKPLVLWYTHGSTSPTLRLACRCADKVLTASRQGFPVKGTKVRAVGHGIDLTKFRPQAMPPRAAGTLRLLSVGRLSPIKKHEVIIRALNSLMTVHGWTDVRLDVIGDVPRPEQETYRRELAQLVDDLGLRRQVRFLGPIPYRRIQTHYHGCDIFVSASQTGSLDKAPLEAIACGKPVIVGNPALADALGAEGRSWTFRSDQPEELAARIADLAALGSAEVAGLVTSARERLVANHELDRLIGRIVQLG